MHGQPYIKFQELLCFVLSFPAQRHFTTTTTTTTTPCPPHPPRFPNFQHQSCYGNSFVFYTARVRQLSSARNVSVTRIKLAISFRLLQLTDSVFAFCFNYTAHSPYFYLSCLSPNLRSPSVQFNLQPPCSTLHFYTFRFPTNLL